MNIALYFQRYIKLSLNVLLPSYCQSELKWVFSVILGEYLGIAYHIKITSSDFVSIEYAGKSLKLSIDFFFKARFQWLSSDSLPNAPILFLDVGLSGLDVRLVKKPIPVLYGKPEIKINDHMIDIGIDVLGTIFFMLTRYEECVDSVHDVHDVHGRFSSKSSIAYRANFLDRPVVDEYVEILWSAVHYLWPDFQRRIRYPRNVISCDVDAPYVQSERTLVNVFKRFGGDILKRHSVDLALQMLKNNIYRLRGSYSADPFLSAIEWIMDVNETVGNKVAFYFIAGHSHPVLDGCYDLDEEVVRILLRQISERGHEIGLHLSYNTYLDVTQSCLEADNLRRVMKNEGIHQSNIGGRQHFLRWDSSVTPHNLEQSGLLYDSSLSFADQPGFRCGTCHEYPMYDLVKRCSLQLRQRPLIVMECAIIAQRYLGLGYSDEALKLMIAYKRTCHDFGGQFTLLWHNSHLLTTNDKMFYMKLIGN